jgi:parallel beta-helix repeat protein
MGGGKKKNGDGPQIICRMTPSAWRPHTMVPTYYVAARGRKGFFATLNDAINFAEPYSRIEVTSGKYFENVIVNKPIEIGTNTSEDVMAEIYSRSVTFTFQADEAYVEGLRIHTADSKSVGVRIEQGSPHIVRCDIDSIEVNGSATPTVEDNKIHDSHLHGLYLLDRAGGLYRANTIENHPGYGIVVESERAKDRGEEEAKFTHNKVSCGELGQVLIKGNSTAVNPVFMFNSIKDEVLDRNAGKQSYSGASALAKLKELPLKKTGDPVHLLPNVIPRGRLVDIDSEEADRNDEYAANDTRAALIVRAGANPAIIQNTVSGGMGNGILIHAGGQGEYVQNKITGNKGFGVCIEDEGTKPLLRDNTISENGSGGLRIRNNGGGVVRKNLFVENRGPQVLVMRGCDKVTVVKNEFYSGPRVGVLCRDRGNGLFEENYFRECYIATRVESQANPTFTKNTFQACHIGAACVRWGRGMFEDNEFANCRQTCVIVTTAAHPTFLRCRMVASEHGILVQHRGRGYFDGNQIKDNSGAQIIVKAGSNPVFMNNFITDGREEGLLVCDGGRGTYTHNCFDDNGINHVDVRAGGDPVMERNMLQKCTGNGITVSDGGYGTYLSNVVEGNRGDGFKVEKGGFPTIRANHIHSNYGAGLHIGDGGDGVFEKNDIAGNGLANVLVTGSALGAPNAPPLPTAKVRSPNSPGKAGSPRSLSQSGSPSPGFAPPHPSSPDGGAVEAPMPVVRRNWIMYASAVGILAQSRGRCAVIENYIAHSGQAAVKVAAGSLLFVTRNTIEGGEGVCVADEGQCFLMGNRFLEVTGSAVILQTGAKPVMAWNTIVGCNVGISCEGGAGVCFENAITECKTGIEAKHFNRTLLTANVVWNCQVGCAILARSKTAIRGNLFRENGTAVTCDGEGIAAVFEGNVLVDQSEAGIVVLSGSATMAYNLLLNNPTGVLVSGFNTTAGVPRITHTVITGGIGIATATRGRCRFEHCIIHQCRMGVTGATHGSATLHACAVTHSDVGVMLWRDGSGDFEFTRIADNIRNVVIAMRSTPQFLRCAITDAKYFNITFSGGAGGTLVECVIARSRMGGGVHVERDANPRVEKCFLGDHHGIPTGLPKDPSMRLPACKSTVRITNRSRASSVTKDRNATPLGGSSAITSPTGTAKRRGTRTAVTLDIPRVETQLSREPSNASITSVKSTVSKASSSEAGSSEVAPFVPPQDISSSSESDIDVPDSENGVAPQRDEALHAARVARRKQREERRNQLDPKDRGIYRGHAVVVEAGGSGTFVNCKTIKNGVAFKLRTGSLAVMDQCTVDNNLDLRHHLRGGREGRRPALQRLPQFTGSDCGNRRGHNAAHRRKRGTREQQHRHSSGPPRHAHRPRQYCSQRLRGCSLQLRRRRTACGRQPPLQLQRRHPHPCARPWHVHPEPHLPDADPWCGHRRGRRRAHALVL